VRDHDGRDATAEMLRTIEEVLGERQALLNAMEEVMRERQPPPSAPPLDVQVMRHRMAVLGRRLTDLLEQLAASLPPEAQTQRPSDPGASSDGPDRFGDSRGDRRRAG
jgi:hypothetical protein